MSAPAASEGSGDDARRTPIAARIALGAQLRRLRQAADISPERAAWVLRASQSKISRLETGQARFKARDVTDLLEFYGVTDQETVARLVGLADQANERGWWEQFGDILPGWFEPYVGLEASASLIRTFDLQFVNGLFQTRDYARAVTLAGKRGIPADEVDRRVHIRMTRQQILLGDHAPRIWSVIDEAALHRLVGGRQVMRDQLRHLIASADLPAVTLQVAPFSIGAHDGASGAFTILRFADADLADIVYIEQLTGALYLDKPAEIDHYLDVVNRLSATALGPDNSLSFLAGVLREI